ncbi:imelysin family protein [Marinospirillum perlucidum]|uniref:imelysin family protein n=1 Tax=Marinospirillum perlucidum TaxID=1982602 RepID=UPI000DF297D0|nr:imelysin family protein [Marinospirillum perlucidum]
MKALPSLAILAAATGLVALTGCQATSNEETQATPASVLDTYADIAEAGYTDSVITAKALRGEIQDLLDQPTEENLKAARLAWLEARVPYQQTEVYRFGNAIVDDWEGKVNAWPLDEGLIDYVDTSSYGETFAENPYYSANVIANETLTVGNRTLDASSITPELLGETLHEIGAVEANVATGYHAIEFLLWGQDLYGTNPGNGERPATDFSLENCTGGNCDRRRDYLVAATDLLITDLEEMAGNWAEGGAARQQLADKGLEGGLATILTGMGSLSYGELGGERTQLGLMLHDPEEEHDCFSDNTHNSHYYDALGIRNVYLGEYTRVDGSLVQGPSLSDLVAAKDAELDEQLRAELDASVGAGQTLVSEAEKGNPFDVLIAAGNDRGNAVVQNFVDTLKTQTGSIEAVISTLELNNIELEGSDSLDNPSAVM